MLPWPFPWPSVPSSSWTVPLKEEFWIAIHESGTGLHYTRRLHSWFPTVLRDCSGTHRHDVRRVFSDPSGCFYVTHLHTANTHTVSHTHTVFGPRLSPWESGCRERTLRQPSPLPNCARDRFCNQQLKGPKLGFRVFWTETHDKEHGVRI